jgi:hypothetical protein
MSEVSDLVRRIRNRAKDKPKRALIQDNPLSDVAAAITLRASEIALFKGAGIECNFDDETDELVITTAPADSTANTIPVDRGQGGTAKAAHAQSTALLVRPRFTNSEILERLTYIVDNELWPQVWLAGEAKLAFQGATEYYSPDVPDIEEITGVYQLSGGVRYPLVYDFLTRTLADDVNFPNGALTLLEEVDATDIYYSYRARPTLGTLSSSLENLAVMGTVADLVMAEEGAHVGGDDSVVQGRVQDGSRLRAGAVLWERFDGARTQLRIQLQHEEQMRRRAVSGVGSGR